VGKDRRKFTRLSLEPPLAVNFKSVPLKISFRLSHKGKALGKNISIGGGLLVELDIKSKGEIGKLLSGREKLSLEISVPGQRSPLKVLGRVVWLKKMDKTGHLYQAGLSFDNINEDTKEGLVHSMIDLCFKQKCEL
jgi:hypothetical protein